jgi:hypothetical protein
VEGIASCGINKLRELGVANCRNETFRRDRYNVVMAGRAGPSPSSTGPLVRYTLTGARPVVFRCGPAQIVRKCLCSSRVIDWR